MRYGLLALLLLSATLTGCGTTKWTDTRRSATEQLLISDAMDRAVSRLDFRALAGQTVYLDANPLKGTTDSEYLISSLRQHMLASGCILKDKQPEANYILEARAGAVGTDHHDLKYGIPAVNIPTLIPAAGFGIPSQIPEMPFVTKTNQVAVAKIAVFAYNRQTGRSVWQSGVVPAESKAKAIWVFGAGPFQRGSIYKGTEFIPLVDLGLRRDRKPEPASVAHEAYFDESDEEMARKPNQARQKDTSEQPKAKRNPEPSGSSSNVIRTGHAPPAEHPAANAPPGNAPTTIGVTPLPPAIDALAVPPGISN